MKINYIGIIACIIAFITLALPWWTMKASVEAMGTAVGVELSVYLHQAQASAMGTSTTTTMDLWFGWTALALIVIAGAAGIVGSLIFGKTGKIILIATGILALLSIIIFAAGLQGELSKAPPAPDFPEVGLFSSGSFTLMGEISMDYSSYLTFGFWLALVAAIISFVSSLRHPMAPPAAPPVAPTTPESV